MSEHRDIGRQQAERLRGEDGLETPPTDPTILRALAAILDRDESNERGGHAPAS